MRRVSRLILTGAMFTMLALVPNRAMAQAQKTTFTGDAVIQAFSVNPDKTADYEMVIAKLKEALAKSTNPDAKKQAAGWKVFKNSTPNPDGSIVYVHVIDPVIPDADYSILTNAYEAVDAAERTNLYNLYRAALKQPLFVIQGKLTADLGN